MLIHYMFIYLRTNSFYMSIYKYLVINLLLSSVTWNQFSRVRKIAIFWQLSKKKFISNILFHSMTLIKQLKHLYNNFYFFKYRNFKNIYAMKWIIFCMLKWCPIVQMTENHSTTWSLNEGILLNYLFQFKITHNHIPRDLLVYLKKFKNPNFKTKS